MALAALALTLSPAGPSAAQAQPAAPTPHTQQGTSQPQPADPTGNKRQRAAQPNAAQPQPNAAAQPDPDKLFQRAKRLRYISEFTRSVELLSDFVRRFPKHEDAPDALQDTFILQLGLGLHEGAARSAMQFDRLYGRRAPKRARKIALAYAHAQSERGAHQRAAQWLERRVMPRNSDLSPTTRVEAQGLLAHSHEALGQTRKAEIAYDSVLGFFGKLKGADFRHDTLAEVRQLGRTLNAVGEARYHKAMKHYWQVINASPPTHRGPATTEALEEHVRRQAAPWMDAHRQRIRQAERAFLQVIRIKPEPPPKWAVRSAARVAEMWVAHERALWNTPVPPMSPQDRALYNTNLKAFTASFKRRAIQALKICIDYGSKYQHEAQEVQQCAHKLSELDKRTVLLDKEMMPMPVWRSNEIRSLPLADPRPPSR